MPVIVVLFLGCVFLEYVFLGPVHVQKGLLDKIVKGFGTFTRYYLLDR
jgi:hypothetical protein